MIHTRIACVAAGLMSVATIQAPAAHRSPKVVALTLAQTGVRAGAIMSVTDFENGETERGRSWPLPSVLGAPATGAVVDSALSDFAQDHPEFRVERSDMSVRLIRRDTPTEVLQTLTRQGVVPGRDQVSISAALVVVVGSLIKQHAISGVLGSGVMPGPGCQLGAPIQVSAGQGTPLDALDNLVSQVPGLSWFVLYDPERLQDPVDIGLWCQDGDAFRVQLPR